MKNITGILALLSVILYRSGYWICEYFYADDINDWRILRDTLTGIVIAILVFIDFFPMSRLKNASLWAFGIFCFGNLWDRLIFRIHVFTWTDWLLTATALIVFMYKIGLKNGKDTG